MKDVFLGQLRQWNEPWQDRKFIIFNIRRANLDKNLMKRIDIVETISIGEAGLDFDTSIMTIDFVLENSRSINE